jgi:hypothetical protein
MATRPDSRGTVTANTYVQLETKTWAAVQKWQALCSTAPWLVCTANRLYYRDAKETWSVVRRPLKSKLGGLRVMMRTHAYR